LATTKKTEQTDCQKKENKIFPKKEDSPKKRKTTFSALVGHRNRRMTAALTRF